MRKAELMPDQVKIMKMLKEKYKKYDDGLHAFNENQDLINKHFRHDSFFKAWYYRYEVVKELPPLKLF